MENIIIDCDPGHDDALAIMFGCANQDYFNIKGVTTVGGNQSLDKITKNAKNILGFLGENIPLVSGQSVPLTQPLVTGQIGHGESGMDGPQFEETNYPIHGTNAVRFMADTIMSSEENITIVALAPLTNIALLIKVFPECIDKIKQISLMGGGINRGNFSASAEFNIYVDPEAAKIVFESGIPVVMSGLDVTEKACITLNEIRSLKDQGKVSHLVYELLEFYNESGKKFGFVDSPIHDACAIIYLKHPEIFKGNNYSVEIVTSEGPTRGMTLADKRLVPNKKNNILVLEDVNRDKFVEVLVDSIKKLDNKVK